MQKSLFFLDNIPLPEGSEFEAVWLCLPSKRLEQDERQALGQIVHEIEEHVRQKSQLPLTYEVYVQMTQIERPAGPLLLSKNSSRWLPSPGVGVWPDKEPPRAITARDFQVLLPGEKIAEFSHQVQRLNTRDEQMRIEAINTLLGMGPVLFMLVSAEWVTAGRRISARLEHRIAEESFRGHPFYVPLLDETSLKTLTPVELSEYLEGVTLYFREDSSRQAILIVSRIPFGALFDHL